MSEKGLLENEDAVLDFWRQNKIPELALKLRQGQKPFIFFEGPPSANAKPAIHHVLARVFKDVVLRYQTMRGRFVPRQAGWDTHGLPIELAVEKKLGLSGKQEIEKYGIAQFNQQAKDLVFTYVKDWEDLTERIGFWLDQKHPYITYENSYIEKLWSVLKEIDQRGLLYKDYKVVPHCPRCETALSSHEVAQGYQKVTEPSVYIKFRTDKNSLPQSLQNITGEVDILAWTTTPWTLPGNVALAVGSDLDYICVNNGKDNLILARGRMKVLQGEYKIITELKGAELVGINYQPLFDWLDLAQVTGQKAYTTVAADFVTLEEGSGIVHTAVMYGVDDYTLGKQLNLAALHTVLPNGQFNQLVKPWAGQFVKADQTQKAIIEYLKQHERLYKIEEYTHDYPFCWRCDTPLLYYAKDSWFIAMEKLRPELLAANETIDWVPAYFKHGRFGEWLGQARDWAISRERYWGTPLPVWICSHCCEREVIGSRQELQLKGKFALEDLHRPIIDQISWPCPHCGKGKMEREPYVVDVWFDSGAMPVAAGNVKRGEYPAEYICEAVDQTRGWFYTLLAVAVARGATAPYRHVISLGHLQDEQGRKMSKSKGNIINPWEVIEQYGVDALRLYFFTVNQPGQAKRFRTHDLAVVQRRSVLLSQNIARFYQIYQAEKHSDSLTESYQLLDRWLESRSAQVNLALKASLESYDIFVAGRLLIEYIDDLANWYLRRSRKRQDNQFLPSLRQGLKNLALLSAPFMPFLAEQLWQTVKSASDSLSVHLADWPTAGKLDQDLLKQMTALRLAASELHQKRANAKIKTRQPLSNASVTLTLAVAPELLDLLQDEVNVVQINWQEGEVTSVALDTQLTPQLIQQGQTREIIRAIQDLRRQAGLKIGAPAQVSISGIELPTRALTEISTQATVTVKDKLVKAAQQKKIGPITIELAKN